MLLVHQTLAGINCSMCKDDLLDSLSVSLESPIMRCMGSSTDNEGAVLNSTFASCLIKAGYT